MHKIFKLIPLKYICVYCKHNIQKTNTFNLQIYKYKRNNIQKINDTVQHHASTNANTATTCNNITKERRGNCHVDTMYFPKTKMKNLNNSCCGKGDLNYFAQRIIFFK